MGNENTFKHINNNNVLLRFGKRCFRISEIKKIVIAKIKKFNVTKKEYPYCISLNNRE